MTVDYSKYQGKKVLLVRNEAGKTDSEELEGSIEATNALGVVLKPKGKSQLILIEASEIERIDFMDEKPKDLVRKTLKLVEFSQARNHLLERHGYTMKQIGELTEKEAFEFHVTLNHVELDLGHDHSDKKETERGQAVKAAETASV